MYSIIKRIMFFLMIALSAPIIANGQNVASLFGTMEYSSNDIKPFKKWSDVRVRHQNEGIPGSRAINLLAKKSCRLSKNLKCVTDEWLDEINRLKDETDIKKLSAINMYLNKARYVTDMVNWRQKDYWATLNQFFNRDGDCEDYAIAKYYSLKELGFTPDQMRIVVVDDTNLNIPHAVLAVYLEEKIWILDNQISKIIEHDNIIHYTPLYSINEKSWWLHKKVS